MKRTHIFLLILVSVIASIIVSTYSDSSTYGTFNDAVVSESTLHVVGEYVRNETTTYNPIVDPNYFSFVMEDKEGKQKQVVFLGPKPVDFERSEQIVVVGKIKGHFFEAQKILLKCPSKYNEEKI